MSEFFKMTRVQTSKALLAAAEVSSEFEEQGFSKTFGRFHVELLRPFARLDAEPAAVDADGAPVPKKPVGRPSTKGTTWEQFINMNRVKGAHMTPVKYVTYCQNTVDEDGNKRDPLKPVMFEV